VQHQTLLNYEHLDSMHRLLAEKKTLQRKRSSSSVTSNSPSDQGYQDTRYATKLEANGSFMKEYRGNVSKGIKEFNDELCRKLLENEQPIPKDSLFSDDYFEATMEVIQDRNEAMINETISQLMFPNVEVIAIQDAKFSPFIKASTKDGTTAKKKHSNPPSARLSHRIQIICIFSRATRKVAALPWRLGRQILFQSYILYAFPIHDTRSQAWKHRT